MKNRLVILLLCFLMALFAFPSLTACGNDEQLPAQLTHNHEHLHLDDVCEKCGWQVLLIDDDGNVCMAKDGNVSVEYYGEKVEGYGLANPLVSVYISDNVKTIQSYAFACKNAYDHLKAIKIGSGLTYIGKDAFGDSVQRCENLSVVSYIGDIASWCNISFTSIRSNPLLYAKYLYINGKLVNNLEIPNTVTEIKNYAFDGCDSLTSITIPNSVTSIGEYAFAGCESLTSITIPNSVTSIGEYAFVGCDNLKNIIISDSVVTIENSAFSYCKNLTTVTLGKSVQKLGANAFAYCDNLKNIIIPNSVVIIQSSAFKNCSNLKTVTFDTTNGWYCTDGKNKITKFASIDLANKQTAAKFLSSTYCGQEWLRVDI